MDCPTCGADFSKINVLESRKNKTAIRRRRECSECFSRFTTFELQAQNMPKNYLEKDWKVITGSQIRNIKAKMNHLIEELEKAKKSMNLDDPDEDS
jgi:transcriptional regulator NrdR family protein